LNFTQCFYRNTSDADSYELVIKKVRPFYLEYYGFRKWNNSTLQAYLNAPNNESVLVADSYQIAEYNQQHPKDPLKILDEVIVGSYSFLSDPRLHSYMLEALHKAGMRLRENGILDRIIDKWVDLRNVRPAPPESEPKVLTLTAIGVAFKIYGFFIALCVIFFAIEFFKKFYNFAKDRMQHAAAMKVNPNATVLPQNVKFRVLIAGPILKNRTILRRLKFQNVDVDIKKWKIVRRTNKPEGQLMIISMDVQSMIRLEETDYSLTFDSKQVKFKILRTMIGF